MSSSSQPLPKLTCSSSACKPPSGMPVPPMKYFFNPPFILRQELLSRNARLRSGLTSHCAQCKSHEEEVHPTLLPLSQLLCDASHPNPKYIFTCLCRYDRFIPITSFSRPRKPPTSSTAPVCILQAHFKNHLSVIYFL